MYVYYLTVLTFIVVFMNSALYIATWIKLYKESNKLAYVLGNDAQSRKSIHNSARNMSLFVLVFFIQWYSLVAYAISGMIGHIPDVILYLAISFNNIGGLLNGIVFIIIVKRAKRKPMKPDITVSVTTISSRV